jgi:hypothetical protein
MRRPIYQTVLTIGIITSLLISCRESGEGSGVTEKEQQERDKVGNIYNSDEQGIDIENKDNQFNSSRNDNVEGYGQETGAASDTIDNDGDKKVNNSTNKQ